MSRSTFTFGQYSLTGGTSVVEVVCGFLLKALKENSLEPSPVTNEIVEQLREHVAMDYGFVRIELPKLKDNDLKHFTDAVSECIAQIRSWGDPIPLVVSNICRTLTARKTRPPTWCRPSRPKECIRLHRPR